MKQEADKKDIKSCWKRDAGKKFAFFKKGERLHQQWKYDNQKPLNWFGGLNFL